MTRKFYFFYFNLTTSTIKCQYSGQKFHLTLYFWIESGSLRKCCHNVNRRDTKTNLLPFQRYKMESMKCDTPDVYIHPGYPITCFTYLFWVTEVSQSLGKFHFVNIHMGHKFPILKQVMVFCQFSWRLPYDLTFIFKVLSYIS